MPFRDNWFLQQCDPSALQAIFRFCVTPKFGLTSTLYSANGESVMKKELLIVAFFTVFTSHAFAASQWVTVFPSEIYVDSQYHGRCGLNTTAALGTLNCPRNNGIAKISFDCGASISGRSKTDGNNMLGSAQLALVLNTNIAMYVSDDQTIDGACTAKTMVVRAP